MTFDPLILPIVISVCSLIVSILVAYFTLFHKGNVKMTPPTLIYFGADAGSRDTKSTAPKVYLRTLLYSSAKRGNVISSLYVRLTRGETIQTFNIWAYGEVGALMPGSGLFVGEQGVAFNHHFLPPADGTAFKFLAGDYLLELFAVQVNHAKPKLLWSVALDLPQHLFDRMSTELAGGLYYEWQPNSGKYYVHHR